MTRARVGEMLLVRRMRRLPVDGARVSGVGALRRRVGARRLARRVGRGGAFRGDQRRGLIHGAAVGGRAILDGAVLQPRLRLPRLELGILGREVEPERMSGGW